VQALPDGDLTSSCPRTGGRQGDCRKSRATSPGQRQGAAALACDHLTRTLPPAWPSKLAATGIVAAGAWGGWGYLRSLNLKPIARTCLRRTARPSPPRPGQPCLSLSLAWGLLLGPCLPVPPGAAAPQVPGTASASGTAAGRVELSQSKHTLTSQSRFSRPVQQLQLDQSHKLKRTVSPGLVTPRLPPIGFAQSLRGRRMIARCRAWEAMIAQEARCRAWEARGHAGEGGGRYEEAHRCRRRTTSCTC
jgi:hypothetical protein